MIVARPSGQTFGIVRACGIMRAYAQIAANRGFTPRGTWRRRAAVALWWVLLPPALIGLALAWVVAALLAAIWVGISRLARAVAARAG
jgi:hypothetical protein